MRFLTSLNMGRNQIKNFIIQQLGTAPSTPDKGQMYFNTTSDTLFIYDGTTWINLTKLDSTDISDFESAVSANADVSANTTKLAGIEAGATADQTGAEIKALYEAEADTNAYTDAEKTKLAGIETAATADQTGAEIKALYEAEADTNAYTDAEKTKLAGIETAATADQTGAEIKALYEAEADTNAFTDADHSKLDGIEALADVTDATNVAAAGAVMESDTTTAAMSFVVDEDDMVSDSNTKVPTQQSVKAYVDAEIASTVAGSMEFVGGYDAATNTPDLDTSPSGISKGDMYTVTVAGTFFTADVEPGDTLIAEKVDPTLESDWTIVQANLTPTSIKTQYESNANTNAFTDAEQTKLAGIEDSATADQTGAEIKALYEAELDTNAFTDADHSKLDGIEAGATSDQTGAEIKALYEAEADTNAFTDADHSKLDGIEALADVTDATNVDAAGAVMESDTTTANMSFVVDEDDMTSDSNTKVPTQQSVKAYVDNELTGSGVSADFGDGAATSFVITHNFGTRDVMVQIRENASPYEFAWADVEATDLNTVTIRTAVAPTSNEFKALIKKV